jgi:alpha 1,3-glucosidase
MNEPSVFNGPEVSMHRDMIHDNGWEHRAVHQIYGMMQHRATFEGHMVRDPNSRPFVLSRAFFAGSQRWGAIWTGDNGAEWGHLKSSVPMLLSLGISGMPFVGADVGGFFGNPDAELVWRWYQIAAHQPFFRAHAHLDSKRREPWVFEEPWTGRMRNAIRMRYRLLPLWNLLFYKASVNGEPPMRPIWYNYPTETDTFGIETEFMVGDSLLISAVMEEGKLEVETYFPPGNWFRLDDHENVYKNNMIVSAGEEEQVPTFIRGGTSFAVRDRIRRSSTLMENDPVSLIIALDESSKSSGQVYFDDGITHDYQNNEFILANIESNLSQIQYSLDESSGAFNSPAWVEKIEVYGFSKLPKEVLLTTNESSWTLLNVKLSGTTLIIRKPGVKVNAGFRIKFEF